MNPTFKALLIIGIILFVMVTCGCAGQRTGKSHTEITYQAEITVVKEKGGRVDWSCTLNVVAFDKRGVDGFYDVYLMDPDGSHERCLTCDTTSHHNGNPAWHPSGEWIVFQSVDTALLPVMNPEDINAYTNPGAGWLNNLWVMDNEGSTFYQLTSVGTKGGVLHPHFSHDGTKLLWAERVEGDETGSTGEWALKIADFTITENGPVIGNIRSFSPGEQHAFCESHGFSFDDTRILFSGNLQKDQPMYGLDIYELDLETQKLTQLTESFYEWDEHAHYSPDGQTIVWMSSAGYNVNPLRADFWLMNADGSHKQQLTFFNESGHPHYRGVTVAADSTWGPDGTIIAYIKTERAGLGSEGSIVRIELKEEGNSWILTCNLIYVSYLALFALILGMYQNKIKRAEYRNR